MPALEVVELIAQCHNEFDIEYGGFLSNHTTHGLMALDQLNASSTRIDLWYAEYQEHTVLDHKLDPAQIESNVVITSENWRDWKGKRTDFPNLFSFFQKQLQESSVQEMVQEFVPELINGFGGSALHPMIHLGLALDYKKSGIAICEGLAYLVHSYLRLQDYSPSFPESDANEACNLTELVKKVYHNTELWNMMRVANIPSFQTSLKLLIDSPTLLSFAKQWKCLQKFPANQEEEESAFYEACKEIATVSTFAFYNTSPASSEFFILHGVTGAYATIAIAKMLKTYKERMAVLFQFLVAFLSTYVVEGCPSVFKEVEERTLSKNQNWDDILAAVTDKESKQNDVHVVKLVFVCHQFKKLYGDDPLWLNAAGCCVDNELHTTDAFQFYLGRKEDPALRNEQ